MNEATLQRIEELTEKVNQLLLARETVPAPITLKIYPMLKDASPSIEEDFFRIQLTEEEQKNAIYSCPRSSFMSYLPPPLNDSASAAVRKADSTLHGIQVALAQATRPVDNYVHRIIQDNPGIAPDDLRFLFTDTMGALLSDIAATVTQMRLDNLHRGMDLPGKPQQLVESEIKPLMDQDKLDALLRKKHQQKKPGSVSPFAGANGSVLRTVPKAILLRRKPRKLVFRPTQPTITRNNQLFAGEGAAAEEGLIRNPNGAPVGGRLAIQPSGPEHRREGFQDPVQGSETDDHGFKGETNGRFDREDLNTTAIDDAPTSVQAEAQSRGPPDPDGGIAFLLTKKAIEEVKTQDPGFYCQLFVIPKKTGRLRPTNQAKVLHSVSRSRRRIHAHSYTQFLQEVSPLLLERESIPIHSAPVWSVSQPAHFYQGAPPNTIMGKNKHIRISAYLDDILIIGEAGIQNKVREVDNNAISVNNPSWYGNQFTEHKPQSSFLKNLGPPPRSDKTIESWPDDVEMPGELYWKSPTYVDCPAPRLSNAETTLGTQEQVLMIDEDMDINYPRTGTLYRCQRHRLGDSCGLTILLRIVESFGGVDAHQRQRTINDLYALRLQNVVGRSEVLLDDLPETARNCRRNMEPLHNNKHAPPGHICSVCNESSGCTEPTDRTDGMTKKLSTNTIKSYKSAILNLVSDPRTVGNSPCIKEFLRAIDETEIKSFVNPEIDISPIVLKINEWGNTSGLDNQKLTTKCCWLLSLCGFLRASDIHRIDDARTIITEYTLKLVIIAPKEKRKGQPIERPCEINRHPNHILCPVLAYTVYKARIATELCPTPHANNDSIIVNRLFRHTKYYNKPLSVDSITRHVKNLLGLIKRPPNTPIPKTRAIGATLAATSGVPVENIASHAFWSNYSMFDTYYRLDRSTQSNMTEAVLVYQCGGSLIGDQNIITAAHCLSDGHMAPIPIENVRIVVGKHVRRTEENKLKLYSVSSQKTFGYDKGIAYDFAMYTLSTKVPEDEATPIKIYAGRICDNIPVQVLGFGSVDDTGIKHLPVLQKVNVDISSSTNCSKVNPDWKNNNEMLICQESRGINESNDSCVGDSGGPLITRYNNTNYLVGAVSRGRKKIPGQTNKCGKDVLGFYARVGYYLNYISRVTKISKKNLTS
ncbi:hypothetical protein BB561_006235 [Smittium simulii]|uniref:Peptidase S1 domain-containing protein n=1 Tax=Smittium simulii TaxID=133385 RepID=A0A2T9Y5Q4_9FUNG|nr:hypothetical protein BB561_006235 [Smittium simulii]